MAMTCGVPLRDVLRMTPAEAIRAVEAGQRRARYARQAQEQEAWLTGLYVRLAVHSKQYPPPPTGGGDDGAQPAPPRRQSVEEMKAVMRGLANRGRRHSGG